MHQALIVLIALSIRADMTLSMGTVFIEPEKN